MRICWFAEFRGPTAPDSLAPLLAATPGLDEALIHTSASTRDPYLDDGPPPSLALQLYFQDIADLEAALAVNGHLQPIATLPGIVSATQQAMIARPFLVADPDFRPPGPPCTYLVAYDGPADDLNLWLDHYIRSHPPIMARFPGIRQIEICTAIDWIGFLALPRATHMQRNKVVFDNQAALTAALNSPVRHEMRADFKLFPPFRGGNTHYPMHTRAVRAGKG